MRTYFNEGDPTVPWSDEHSGRTHRMCHQVLDHAFPKDGKAKDTLIVCSTPAEVNNTLDMLLNICWQAGAYKSVKVIGENVINFEGSAILLKSEESLRHPMLLRGFCGRIFVDHSVTLPEVIELINNHNVRYEHATNQNEVFPR